MTAAIPVPVICCCSWTGSLPSRTACPSCGRSFHDRATPGRLAALRAIAVQSDAPVTPAMRIRLIAIGVLRNAGTRIPPNESGRRKRMPRRHHALTAMGLRVLAAADRIVAEQTRDDVAASVARHVRLLPCGSQGEGLMPQPHKPGLASRLLERPGARVEFTAHDRMEVPYGE